MSSFEVLQSLYPAKLGYTGPSVGGTSWYGYRTDLLKSAIQKYIRRGNFEKAFWCALDFDLISELRYRSSEENARRGLKALSTNLIHRLLIISIEDIGIGNISLIPFVDRYVDQYKKNVEQSQSSVRRECLYHFISRMCKSQRSRELSHIRNVYYQVFGFDGKTYIVGNQSHIFSMQEMKQKYPEIYNFDIPTLPEGKDQKIGSICQYFESEFKSGKDSCFYWFFQLLQEVGDNKGPIKSLCNIVIASEKDQKRKYVMNTLLSWYGTYTFEEHILFAMQIVLIGLRQIEVVDIPPHENIDIENIVISHLKSPPIEIDEYAYDMHTAEGKKKQKESGTNGREKFAIEGSYVEDEYPGTNQKYKEIYTTFRTYEFINGNKPPSKTQTVASISSTGVVTCEGVYSSGAKKGTKCTNKWKHEVDEDGTKHYYCGIHLPKEGAKKKSNGTTFQNIVEPPKQQSTVSLVVPISLQLGQNDVDEIHNSPYGQLPTGNHKKLTFIPTGGKFAKHIVKGPWKQKDIPRLNKMTFRMKALSLLGISICKFVVIGSGDMMYTLYRNVSTVDPSQWKMEMKMSNIVGKEIPVLDRDSMGITQMHKLTPQEQKELLFGKYFLFKALFLLALLRVGDVGFYNIIISGGIPYVIDFEEDTSKTDYTSLDDFLAHKSDKAISLIREGIKENKDKVKTMLNEVANVIPKLTESCEKYGISNDFDSDFLTLEQIIEVIQNE